MLEGLGGSSTPQVETFSVSKTLTLSREQPCVEFEYCSPHTVNISNVNFTSKYQRKLPSNSYLFFLHRHVEFSIKFKELIFTSKTQRYRYASSFRKKIQPQISSCVLFVFSSYSFRSCEVSLRQRESSLPLMQHI